MTNYRCEKWAKWELDLLAKLYPIAPINKLENSLVRHTAGAIYQKAFVLGLKKKRIRVIKGGEGR